MSRIALILLLPAVALSGCWLSSASQEPVYAQKPGDNAVTNPNTAATANSVLSQWDGKSDLNATNDWEIDAGEGN